MAGSLNRVTLVGNVGDDPEIRNLNSGQSVANLSIATSEAWKDKNSGEKQEKTDWHRVVIWNENIVEVVNKYVKKGSKLLIEGKLQTRKWQDQDGKDRYSTEVVLTGFDCKLLLLGDPRGGGDQGESRGASRDTGRRSDDNQDRGRQDQRGGFSGGGGGFSNDLDDDIPFSPEWR